MFFVYCVGCWLLIASFVRFVGVGLYAGGCECGFVCLLVIWCCPTDMACA